MPATQSSTLSRKALFHPDFVANTPSDDTPQAKNDALPASFAKLFAQHRRSQSKLKSEKMAQGEPQDTTST
jgi:hypothetical protein